MQRRFFSKGKYGVPDEESPELKKEDFKNFKPFLEWFPQHWKSAYFVYCYDNGKLKFRQRKKYVRPVEPIGLRYKNQQYKTLGFRFVKARRS